MYLSDILRRDWQEVDFVSEPLGGLDSRNVGVNQHSLDILFLQSLNSLENKTRSYQLEYLGEKNPNYPDYQEVYSLTDLRAGVVKLPGLSDGKSSRAQDENLPGSGNIFRLGGTVEGEMVHQTLLHC